MRGLSQDPGKCFSISFYSRSFGASIFKVIYGIEVKDSSDMYLRIADKSMKGLAEALVPWKYWVDFLSFLKYIPSWVPGVHFTKVITQFKPSVIATKEAPYQAAHSAWVSHVRICVSKGL